MNLLRRCIKQIMNVFLFVSTSLNGTFHLSPNENICSIALINIHYLYDITVIVPTICSSSVAGSPDLLVAADWVSFLTS